MVHFYNESGHVGYFMPVVELIGCGTHFSIINHSDNDRKFSFDRMDSKEKHIRIDNDLGLITWDSDGNPYEYFNFNFLRLVNGDNYLEITGDCILRIICEFPVNVGG